MPWRCSLFGHRWRLQSAHPVDVLPAGGGDVPVRKFTRVLMRCECCPEVKVRHFDGHWTLTQFMLGEEMHDSPQSKVSA